MHVSIQLVANSASLTNICSANNLQYSCLTQQAGQFLAGERNYVRIEGATGPVVYPAGHLYVYAALRRLTSGGEILPAQWIFAALYLASLAVILFIYIRSEAVAPWKLPLLALSRRLHSIYMLRQAMLSVHRIRIPSKPHAHSLCPTRVGSRP